MAKEHVSGLADAMQSLWDPSRDRNRTLARLIKHGRQIEQWWKCELATHLWELAKAWDVYVWLESHDRADITLADAVSEGTVLKCDPEGKICIPLELKMVSTSWGKGNVQKAFGETGKKRLQADLEHARAGRRKANPFSAVALLLTHLGGEDRLLQTYLGAARRIGVASELRCVLDGVRVPHLAGDGHEVEARQFLWVT